MKFDVIVIGAGVIGGSIAYNLAKQGRSVLVLEKGKIASQASSAAAGMLGAQTELEKDSPLSRLARESRSMFPDLSLELKQVTGIDIELNQNGMLKVAQSEEEVCKFKRLIESQQKLGEEAYWLDSAELLHLEPHLEQTVYGAMSIPNDGNVSAPNLTKAFAAAAKAKGAVIKENQEVAAFITESNRVTGVQTKTGDIYHAENVIVAGGAWSEKLLREVGIELATYPVKGECFSVRTEKSIIQATIFSKECYLVPKTGGRLIIGATERANRFDQNVSLESIQSLMTYATKLLPALKDTFWEGAWAGIRPQISDGLPYLGEHPKVKGLFVATGHFRNGILLAPITGKLMAKLVCGEQSSKEWVDAFRLERNKIGVESK